MKQRYFITIRGKEYEIPTSLRSWFYTILEVGVVIGWALMVILVVNLRVEIQEMFMAKPETSAVLGWAILVVGVLWFSPIKFQSIEKKVKK